MGASGRATITIVGGGMVGISFALALAGRTPKNALRIRLLESFPLRVAGTAPVYSPSFDARSTALSWGSVQILERIGVWSSMAQHAAAIHRIHVSQAGHWGANRIRREDAGVQALGQVVENQWIGATLAAALQAEEAIELIAPASVQELRARPGDAAGWRLTLQTTNGEQTLDSDLVVLADGGRSGLRAQLGIDTRSHDYGQEAIICNLRCEKPHRQQAFERFTEHGPLAMLPLPDERMSLVWSLEPAQAAAMETAPDAEFIAALQDRFGFRLGRIQRIGQRARYPLRLEVAEAPVRDGLILLGNAAHALHPIAGQGFNLSIRDLDALATVLAEGVAGGMHIGARALLDQYVEMRRDDQQRTLGLTHGLNALFSNLLPGLPGLRSAGMVATELLPGLRDSIARQAMGVNA